MNIMSAVKVIGLGAMIGVVGCGEGVAAESTRLQRPQDLLGKGYRFTEKDFQKEVASDKLFYIPIGVDDDGMKEVSPNLQKMPAILKDAQALVAGYRPSETGDKRGKVFAYYPESTYKHTVDYVGDGWVIARAYSLMDQKYFRGFIYTDENDMYVDGQKLQHAYYALVGVQKVPLANGSSQSMYAFVKLDSETCRLAFEAREYNDKALYATKKENDRREVARRDYAYKQERERVERPYHKELAKVFNGFAFRDIKSQFHFPEELSDMMDEIEFKDLGTFNFSKSDNPRTGLETNFVNAIKTQDWKYVVECVRTNVGLNDNPVQCASNALQSAYGFTRYFRMPKYAARQKLKKYACYIVDLHGNEITRLNPESFRYLTHLPIDVEFYCIKDADVQFVKKFVDGRDTNGFIAACKEGKVDKFNSAFEKAFVGFEIRDVESQYHFPENPISIKVRDGKSVMYGDSESENPKVINEMFENKEWVKLATCLGIKVSPDTDPALCAKDALVRMSSCWRMICLASRSYEPQKRDRKTGKKLKTRADFCFFIVDENANEQVKVAVSKDYRDFLKLTISAELYCVPKEEKELFDNLSDASIFEETWKKKYGKMSAEQ